MAHSWRDVHHQTFYEGIESFPNACFAWVRPDGTYDAAAILATAGPAADRASSSPRTRRRPSSAAGSADAVAVRMRADVPIGFELSGGLDSSCLVAAAASARAPRFTPSPSPSPARQPTRSLTPGSSPSDTGTWSTTPCSARRPDEFWGEADEYVGRIAEPFHAPNILTNRGVWRAMAARGIRVSINGAAGDESWGGYFNDYYEPFLRHLARRGDSRPPAAQLPPVRRDPARPLVGDVPAPPGRARCGTRPAPIRPAT